MKTGSEHEFYTDVGAAKVYIFYQAAVVEIPTQIPVARDHIACTESITETSGHLAGEITVTCSDVQIKGHIQLFI